MREFSAEGDGILRIKEAFDERFGSWDISLATGDCLKRRAGTIQSQGWMINYQFGNEQGREFLDYFSRHRMTNDTLERIWDDGSVEVLGDCQEFFLADDPEAEQAYYEHNRRFYEMVREKGLL